jgi:hypothetical protein
LLNYWASKYFGSFYRDISETRISNLSNINERKIVEIVIANDLENWKKQRVLKSLNSGFSLDK